MSNIITNIFTDESTITILFSVPVCLGSNGNEVIDDPDFNEEVTEFKEKFNITDFESVTDSLTELLIELLGDSIEVDYLSSYEVQITDFEYDIQHFDELSFTMSVNTHFE